MSIRRRISRHITVKLNTHKQAWRLSLSIPMWNHLIADRFPSFEAGPPALLWERMQAPRPDGEMRRIAWITRDPWFRDKAPR